MPSGAMSGHDLLRRLQQREPELNSDSGIDPVLAVELVILGFWFGGNAAATWDDRPVDEDVVHDGEAYATGVSGHGRGRVGALIVAERDTHHYAARDNRRECLRRIRRHEPHLRPLSRILGGRCWRPIAAAAYKVERL